MAAGQLEGQPDGLHHIVGHGSAAVGAVIVRAVVRRFADHGDDRVNVLHVKPEVGVALVVLQKDVVFRHVALDEGAFQHQRFKFGSSDNDVKMVDFAHHQPGLGGVGRRVLKILADPVFQLLRLAHIDDLIRLVPHDVHAGGIGQGQGFFFQFIKGHCLPLTSVKKVPPQCIWGIEAVK